MRSLAKKVSRLYFIFFLSFLWHPSSLLAQNTGVLRGQLTEKNAKKPSPLALATITVFNAKDTALITYRLSDDNGVFKVPGLPLNTQLRALITYSGYKVIRKDFELPTTHTDLDLGQIAAEKDTSMLAEVLVMAETPPVVVRNDTIEFNAASFKTLPTSLVEDLLRKMPGMVVDRNGNITFNGKKVDKIFVDGRDFFGNDPKIASRNLPSNIIDKVQVTDDKDVKYLNPNAPDWEIPQVINLKLKKEIKKGWFGKAFGGYGTNDQYDVGGIVNTFRDTLQLSLLGYSNNLNRTGFSSNDLTSIGGFQRSGFNNLNINNDNITIDGVSFGGGATGLNRSTGAGTNINTLLDKKTTLNLEYFYGNESTEINKIVNTEQFIADTVLNTTSVSRSTTTDQTHRISTNIRHTYSPVASLVFKPGVNFGTIQNGSQIDISSITNLNNLVSQTDNKQNINQSQFQYTHDLLYNNFRVRKAGRIIRFSNSLNVNNGDLKQQNIATTTVYVPQLGVTLLDQLRKINAPSFLSKTDFTYIEPISKKMRLTLTESVSNFSDEQGIFSYNKNPLTNDYTIPIDSISGTVKRQGFRSLLGSNLNWNISNKLGISFGVNWQWIDVTNSFINNYQVRQDYHFVLPSIRAQWKKISLSYSARVVEPSASDLQPVVDNTNPLSITLGNINLKPSVYHTASISTGQFDGRKALTYNINISGTVITDAIIRERTIAVNGIQTSYPVNVNGSWYLQQSGGFTDRVKLNKDWLFLLRGQTSNGFYNNTIIINARQSTSGSYVSNSSVELNFNWKDKIEFYPKYTFATNNTSYSDPTFQAINYVSHRFEVGIVYRTLKKLVFESNLDYQYNPLVPVGIKKDVALLNAAVNYVFLKGDKGVLKLSVFDLLNENNGISRSISENYIQTMQIQLIHQYFLLTFTYNIRSFGTKKVGGKEGLFRL